MAVAGSREIRFIAVYIVVMLFFGISEQTTNFFFPDVGTQVYKIINFYFVAVIALMVLIVWLAQGRDIPSVPKVPPLWAVMVNFSVFFLPAYVTLSWLFRGYVWPLPSFRFDNFVIETIISFSENYIAFILMPAVLGWGDGKGIVREGAIFTIRGYTFKYSLPTLNRLKYNLSSIIAIALLHVGTYSQNVSSWGEFYSVMLIAILMFGVFALIKETFGFGASEAVHDSWNIALTSDTLKVYFEAVKGSII